MSSVSVGCSTTRDLPRMQRVYEWSAEELGEPRLLELLTRTQ